MESGLGNLEASHAEWGDNMEAIKLGVCNEVG
jgi:hypothetical protein